MNISTPFIHRPIATSLLMAAILLIGGVAYPLLPVAPLPQVDFPTIQVTAQFAGASPETMASSVAQPLERRFAQIPGLAQMTSTSALGNTVVSLQFDLARDIDAAAQDVQAAINAAAGQLPQNLPSPPTYRKVNPADAPILVLAVRSEALPLTRINDYADTVIAQQISQISGVAFVALGGEQKPAVRIQIDPGKLASLGLSLEEVRGMILNTTVNGPKGSVDGATRSFAIYNNGQILSAAPWNDAIIAYRNGAPVRIRDVGSAVDGPQNTKLAAWENGIPSIILVIFKQPGANVIDTVDKIKAALPRMAAAIPPVVKIDVASDRTQTIRASVADVQFTMLETIALVVAVIFLFLRNLWATIIPSVTVPLALAGTFALMYAVGYTLDNLSLMGLTIAVGFVVDDAIVMLENIYRHRENGLSPVEAAIAGAGEIGFTIVSISLWLVAVFIPLLLMGGIVGRLFREFAVVVSMMILVSAVVALTLTPMMCARFLGDEKSVRHGRLYLVIERGFEALLAGYRHGLDLVLRHQAATLATFVATVCLTGYLFVIIPKQLADVASDQQNSAGTLTLTIDRDQASRFGIQPQLIDDTLYDAFGQRQVTQYFTQLNSYYVILEVLPELQGLPATLDKLYVKSPLTGQAVPLSTFVKYTTRPISSLSINHQGQFPAVTLSFNLAAGHALGDAVAAIQAAEAELGKPATVISTFQGNAQAFQASLATAPLLIAASLVAVYIILGVLYESYIHPLTILSTLPSAGLGALLMLFVAGQDLNVIALIGIILLIGIVKKNGIMMVDFAIAAERDGLPPLEAIRRACLLRFRPIMMTTMAALLGGLPLMLGTGTGSELRQPLGYAMVGGLLLSQALTLFTTPVIYLYLDRLNVWLDAAPQHKRKQRSNSALATEKSQFIGADSDD